MDFQIFVAWLVFDISRAVQARFETPPLLCELGAVAERFSTEAAMLQTPYGVVSGTVDHADLENPDGGQWPHYHVWIDTPAGLYDSAINLKSLTQVQIEYRTRDLDQAYVANVLALANGWNALAQTSVSGAWDYVRHPGLTGTTGWTLQTGDNLINVLRYLLTNVERIHIFGASYSSGLGVHDVHMNQGDPAGSEFAPLDGIWQDGGILFEYGVPQPRITALQIKFSTQSLYTDDEGHPRPIRFIPPIIAYIPQWKWPPGDPMTQGEREVLVAGGLFEMLQWARAIYYVRGEAQIALSRELNQQLQRHLPHAQAGHIEEIADYIVKMGVVLA
ncbi:DUF2278 family protein [Paraburkholderia fungorum]|uniref:DUF2278 family protein n=1 Tax=Paraburkholderia fungorum TaxID=134537 RepID=UPI0038BC4AF5